MTEDSTRRRVLAAAGASAVLGLAGCATGGPGSPEGTGRTTTRAAGTDATTDPPAGTTDAARTSGAAGTDATDGEGSGSTTGTTGESTATAESTTANATTRTVEFTSPSGNSSYAGTLYPAGGCAVVLVPDLESDRAAWAPQAARLQADGVTALAITGENASRATPVLGALQYLRDRGYRVVLAGADTGGEAVLRASFQAERGSVAGTVALSPSGGPNRPQRVQGRKLVVVAEDDADRYVEVARELHRGFREPEQLLTVPGSARGHALFDANGDRVYDALRSLVAGAC